MEARVLFSDHGVAVAEAGPVCVAIWRGSVTRVRFQEQRAGLTEVVARHPRGAAFLCVIEATANPPNDELRQASVQLVGLFGAGLKCVALVVEAVGFRGVALRGAISAMVHLRRAPRPLLSVFSETPSAVRWMGEHVPLENAEDVVSRVEEIRAVMPPRVETF
jgi:hypothetical protein